VTSATHFLVAVSIASAVSIATLAAQRGPVRPPLIREGATVKVAAHTYAIPNDNVGAVPNVGIVVGSRATLVIDPGLGRQNGETVLREAGKVSRNSELYVASTHYHVEHTTGIIAFPSTAKYVNSKVQEEEYVEGAAAQSKTFANISAVHAELLKEILRGRADITFDREHSLDLGGVRVRMLVVGPTHTRGDTVLFVEGDNVLFAGDVVMNTSFVAANPGSSMKAWLAAFDALEAMRPTVVVPAHGPLGDGSLIGINRGFMQAILARVRELKAQGRPIDEIAATVQMEMQAKHPTFARANGVAGAARAAYAEAP
jgi:glyoxylase-like metal-dependent hydrolase (beta-lactamase superfamily II)